MKKEKTIKKGTVHCVLKETNSFLKKKSSHLVKNSNNSVFKPWFWKVQVVLQNVL